MHERDQNDYENQSNIIFVNIVQRSSAKLCDVFVQQRASSQDRTRISAKSTRSTVITNASRGQLPRVEGSSVTKYMMNSFQFHFGLGQMKSSSLSIPAAFQSPACMVFLGVLLMQNGVLQDQVDPAA